MRCPVRSFAALALASFGAVAACTTTPVEETLGECVTSGATTLSKEVGDAKTVVVGNELVAVVKVTNASGTPVCGVVINWTVGAGSGSTLPTTVPTSSVDNAAERGTATTLWTVGPNVGTHTLIATIANSSPTVSAVFSATAVPEGTCLPVRTIIVTDDFSGVNRWSSTVLSTQGNATSSVTTETPGGNPGAFRKMTQELGLPVGAFGRSQQAIAHLYTFSPYTPGVSGAICSITYREDQINSGGGEVQWGVIATQDGVIYRYSPTPLILSTAWVRQGPYELEASDFEPAGLNFENGTKITFGYFRLGTTAVNPTQAVTATHGIDNWYLEIHRQ